MKRTLFFLFILITGLCVGQNPVSFTEEYIEFRIKPRIFQVNGEYHFQNNTVHPVEKKIYFPIPSVLGKVDSASVFNKTTGEFVPFDKEKEGIRFRFVINANDYMTINVFYVQQIRTDSVTYILTTTQLWEEPLKRAEYSLLVDGDNKVKEFWIFPDGEVNKDNQTWYYWKRRNFMPDKDFVIHLSQ